MITCEEFADKTSDYLEGRVPYGERVGMWIHTLMCEPCRRYLEQVRQTVDFIQEVGEREHDEGAPDEVKEDLMEQFRDQYDTEPPS